METDKRRCPERVRTRASLKYSDAFRCPPIHCNLGAPPAKLYTSTN